jgi:hypothetical protein
MDPIGKAAAEVDAQDAGFTAAFFVFSAAA